MGGNQLILMVNDNKQLEYVTEEIFREELFEKSRLFRIGKREKDGIEVVMNGIVYNVLSYFTL